MTPIPCAHLMERSTGLVAGEERPILARMGAWYQDLDDSALTALLERGIAAADAIGRLEVQAETEAPGA